MPAAWIRTESSTGDMAIVQKYNATGDERQYRFATESSGGTLRMFISASPGTSLSATAAGATDVCTGSWVHAAAVYNDTDIRIYVNGVLDSNEADNPMVYTSGINDGGDIFTIGVAGGVGDFGQYFDGLIDQPVIFDRALSAAEILDLYNDGIEGEKGGNDSTINTHSFICF